MAKKLTTLYLDVELVKRLNKLSAMTRVPMAVYTREAIDLALDKHEKKIEVQLGKEKLNSQQEVGT
jgi:predicted DNA-binding protein